MSYFIFSIPSAGLIEIPPVSNVIPLPTNPNTGASAAPAAPSAPAPPSGSYRITISAGGSGDPCDTAQNAPIPSSCSFAVECTSHSSPTASHIAFARRPSSVGVSTFPGSFTRARAKFCARASTSPSSNPCRISSVVARSTSRAITDADRTARSFRSLLYVS